MSYRYIGNNSRVEESTDEFDGIEGLEVGTPGTRDGIIHATCKDNKAVPVLTLEQDDLSDVFIKFISQSAATNAQPILDAADLSTPGAVAGYIKIQIEDEASSGAVTDGNYYIPFHATPTA